jgi:PAS domain S-box-containing protein
MAKTWSEKLVLGTADAAFAVDSEGLITAWNPAATELFGVESNLVIGQPCRKILRGADDGGGICSDDCTVARALQANSNVTNFDVKVETALGRRWCNISVLIVDDPLTRSRHAIHIVHLCEKKKRLERLVQDFVANESRLTKQLIPDQQPPNIFNLSTREIQVLKLLAKSMSTAAISTELCISNSTVKNHVKHIMAKLEAHSRLQAVRRGQEAGLV